MRCPHADSAGAAASSGSRQIGQGSAAGASTRARFFFGGFFGGDSIQFLLLLSFDFGESLFLLALRLFLLLPDSIELALEFVKLFLDSFS